MNLEEVVLERLRHLPVDKQQQLLEFAEFLAKKTTLKPPLRTVRGLCADLKVDITEEDIAQARQEMWCNLPKDILE